MKVTLTTETIAHYQRLKAKANFDDAFDIVVESKTILVNNETIVVERTKSATSLLNKPAKKARKRYTVEELGKVRQRAAKRGKLIPTIPDSILSGITEHKPGKARIDDLAKFYAANSDSETSPFTVDIADFISSLERQPQKVYNLVSPKRSFNQEE